MFVKFLPKVMSRTHKKYSQKEILEFKEIFKELDENGNGTLSMKEFEGFLTGIELPFQWSRLVFFFLDVKEDAEITFDDFVRFMAATDKLAEDPLYLFKRIFLKIDKDKNKKLDKEEVSQFMALFAGDLGEVDIDAAFKEMDVNGDGLIGFGELMHALGH